MSECRFIKMKDEYLPRVLDIYNYYVANTTVTFHRQPIDMDEMRKIVYYDNPRYSSHVIINEDEVCGYCLFTQFKTRDAYDITAEITVYLAPESIGKGLGSKAVSYIEEIARSKAIHSLIAIITGENGKSIKLFEKNGYQKCGHFKEVGMKFDRLLDVVYYQKIIN